MTETCEHGRKGPCSKCDSPIDTFMESMWSMGVAGFRAHPPAIHPATMEKLMTVKGQTPKAPTDITHGSRGKNDNWPGCTEEFVNHTTKRRKKNKEAKKSRKKNRKK